MYVFLFTTGAARAFWLPARAAFLPRLVPRDTLPNAISWNATSFELASIVGPAVGGLLIGFFQSALLVYLMVAVAALAFLVLILTIPYDHQNGRAAPLDMRSLLGGIRYIRNTPVVLAAMTLDMFGVLLGGATAMMPIYAKDILQVGPRGLGWLMAAPSLGAITMAMIQAHRPPTRRAGRKLLLAVAGFGAVTTIFGLSQNFWLSLTMLFFLGVCDNISVVIRSTLIQLLTPDEMRGRVSAINSLFIGTSNELGAFESGVLARFLGPVIAVVSGGLGAILVVLIVAWRWPQLRHYKELVNPN
jgi:predicted MFS family arabinose efflux permease